MLACIIIVSLAYTWLLYETRWLTINLREETIAEFDKRVLGEIKREAEEKEKQYQAWLKKRYEPKYSHASLCRSPIDQQDDYPKYKWLAEDEDLEKRRNGEMLYQRGSR